MSDDNLSLPITAMAPGLVFQVEVALALEGYLSDLEAGRPADPEQLIAAHPHLAGPLRACWSDRSARWRSRRTGARPVAR